MDRALNRVHHVAHMLETLSQSDRYKNSDQQAMWVHSYYLKETDTLREDLITKSAALEQLRNGKPADATGLSMRHYERAVTLRLKKLIPVIQGVIAEEEPRAATSNAAGITLQRTRKLLHAMEELVEFFEDNPPSPLMQFVNAVHGGNRPAAEQALQALTNLPLPPPEQKRA